MSVAKISILIGSAIVAVGGTAAVATRDKWWPTAQDKDQGEPSPTKETKKIVPETKSDCKAESQKCPESGASIESQKTSSGRGDT